MKICINTLSVDQTKGGIRYFLFGLIRELTNTTQGNSFYLIVSKKNKDLFRSFSEQKNVHLVTTRISSSNAIARIVSDQIEVSYLASKYDLLITPSNIASLFTRSPQVVIVQAPLAVRSIRKLIYVPKNLTSLLHKLYYSTGLYLSMRKADHIVAVSNFLHSHLSESYPFAANKISTVHEGVSFEIKRRPEGFKPQRFILFVSSLFQYKNADKLIEAFAILYRKHPHLKDLSLILCGKDPDGIQLERLMALSVKLDIEQQVEFKGHVSHEILSKLYANCLTFVYPSSVETFGLPLLEAMAFGAPVICSDKMSVPEVAGDAALVLDPSNTEKFVESLLSVIDNSELAESLSQKGYDRLQQFSWRNCAGQIQEIVENVLVTHKA